MSDSVRPYRGQPTRLHRPWDSPGKNTGVGCHFLLQGRKVKSKSEVVQSCLTPSDPIDCSLPGPTSLSAIRVVSSAYQRLLIFLLEIWIPACASSSPAFLMMYSTYKLNKQGDNIQPWRTPFPIWNQSVVPHLVLTVASRPAYRFLKRQVRWSGIPISWRIFHSLLWSTQSKALA